jgi:hypothetical protein
MRFFFKVRHFLIVLLIMGLTLIPDAGLRAWTEHTLISYPVLSSMPQVKNAQPVKVESLEAFLMAEGKKLEALLRQQEAWAKQNLPWYAPLPETLTFKASADAAEARLRFCRAIRINPNAILPLYLQLIPGQDTQGRPVLMGRDVTFIEDQSDIRDTVFVRLQAGEKANPLDIISTATNEPDLGLDIGLFEDNQTAFG